MMKHLKNLVAPTLTALFIAGVANAAFYNWSKTPSSNATADSTINWSEGQSPSSVNDSARAMMARTAEFRDDISGALTTTGTGTALVVATNQVFTSTALMNNAMIAFVPNVTNTGAVTLAVDGLTAQPIRSQTGSAGNLGAGVLILGSPYVATYKSATSEFLLHSFVGNPYAVPLGSFIFHSVATAPNSNFILPIGQAISRTTYATYFAMVGTTFGVGDGVTTFNVPDLRSRMLLPLATMGGADPGRVTTAGSGIDGATTGATGGAQDVAVLQANLPNVNFPVTGSAIVTNGSVQTSGNININNVSPTNQALQGSGSEAIFSVTGNAASGGSGTALNKMPPVMVLPLLLRIL